MTIAVTRTKVILPRRRAELFTRQRLLDLLTDLLDYKLLIVAAPAGYGKTSLLVDFAHNVEMPVCWYALDSLDRDPVRFITHFIASISNWFPSFGNQSISTLEAASQTHFDLDQLVATIVNEAYEHIQEHFIIVLDDYHLVNDQKEINDFIGRFVQKVDENCHLVLCSRTLLNLPDLPLMVARSQVAGLSFEELAFRTSEIQSLVLQNYHISMPEKDAKELARDTEGWITGLLLSAQTMWQGMTDRLRVARVSGVGLYDYLAEQVLEQQPPEVRDFLLRTSYLEEFDAELCRSVLETGEECSRLMEFLMQNNLFVLPVGDDGRSIRYHHLFRDFLQARLEQTHPEVKKEILRRLGLVYAGRGEWEKAYATYLRLGDREATADLIERCGSLFVRTGRLSTLAEWIDSLPGQILNARPSLLSLRGTASVIQGELDRGLEQLIQAESAQRASGDLTNLAYTLVRLAFALRFQGKYQASLENATQSLMLAERDEGLNRVKADALRAAGMSLYQLGKLGESTDFLKRALAAYTQIEDRHSQAMVLMELGVAYMASGKYNQSSKYYLQALDYWRASNSSGRQASLLNNLGVLHHLKGEYAQAVHVFEEGLARARQLGFTRMEAYILCGIGDLYADLDAAAAAIEAYSQTRQIAFQINDHFLLFYLDLAEAAQARTSGKVKRATELLQSARRLILKNRSSYEEGLWHLEAGRLDLASGNVPSAVSHLEIAVRNFAEGGQKVESARANLSLAEAQFRSGKATEAFQQLEHAIQDSSTLESQHILVVAARNARDLLEAACQNELLAGQVSALSRQVLQFEESIPSLRRRLRPHTSSVPFVPPKYTFQAFGKTQVTIDGKPVTAAQWQTQRRVREFLFYLLAHPEGATKEEIGLVFWPDGSASQLKIHFKNLVYRLRYALGQDILSLREDRYYFNRDLDFEYDVETFQTKLKQAGSASQIGDKIAAYRDAVLSYQGPFLSDADGAWVMPEREHLWQKYVEAVLTVAQLHLEKNEFSTTLEYCQRLLDEDNCQEEAYRLAMRAYAAQGNRAAVTHQFERCRQALFRRINTVPSPQTEYLYKTLLH